MKEISQYDFPHYQAKWVRANSTFPHTVTESKCLLSNFSMAPVVGFGTLLENRLGLISPGLVKSCEGKFQEGLLLDDNESFILRHRLLGRNGRNTFKTVV